jgi:mitochondrial fission protein ELM1
MSELPRVWALLGHRRGDNYQVLALAGALGLPFETRSMRYHLLHRLHKKILGPTLITAERQARSWIKPPWPDLVIGIGHRSVPVTRYIRKASGGRTKIVQIGNPRLHPSNFDLVVTTPQYPVPEAENLLRLPLAMASPHGGSEPTLEELAWLDALPRPHRLMVLGGPTKLFMMPPEDMAATANRLMERCQEDGGTVIGVGSPRSEEVVMRSVEQAMANSRHRFVRDMPRYSTLLKDADEIYVTADSVSMLSEAVFTGRPVGMIPLRMSARGELRYAATDAGHRKPPVPDLRQVWRRLEEQQLIGTVDAPRLGSACDPVGQAAAAVLRLLER